MKHFLHEPEGWIENKIDACLQLAHCYEQLEMKEDCLKALLNSFIYDAPRAEICCEIGRQLLLGQQFQQAVYWYQQALSIKPREFSGAFIQQDCYGFVPYIQLCMCYDRIGNYQEAYRYHLLSKSVKPDSDAVRYNQQYFESRHPEVTQLM